MPRADAVNTITELSEGNPGAMNVLGSVWENASEDTFSSVVAGLRALGYKGSVIWMAYKDWAGCDLKRFIEGVRVRDSGMREVVRRERGLG